VGIGKLTLAVADAGPLVHLSEIGCFSHLRIFDVLRMINYASSPLKIHMVPSSEAGLRNDDLLRSK
jgi:hypothetical protein